MKEDTRLLEQILNDSNQMIQANDIENYSMMYANKPARIYTGHVDQPYEGKHCYEYMMGLKEQEEALKHALAAERVNRAKTTFLNNISHDIRTSMNAIIGFTALAATHIENQDPVKKLSQEDHNFQYPPSEPDGYPDAADGRIHRNQRDPYPG